MSQKTLLNGIVVVLLGSLLGVTLGQATLRIASAKEKPVRKRTTAALRASTASVPCPTIKVPSLSLVAADYSADEGLTAPSHTGVDSAFIEMQVTGLPNNTYAPVVLTFALSTNQITITRSDPHPNQSPSIAQALVSVYLSAAGSNLLIQTNIQSSRGGVIEQIGNPVPTGTLQYTVMVTNGTANISAIIQASAVTSLDSATASSMIMLDLLDASFSTTSSNAPNRAPASVRVVPQLIFGRCPNNCGKLTQQIEDRIAELKTRYDALLTDTNNLYCEHYFIPLFINGENMGSYFGHIIQFNQKQSNLRKLMAMADSQLCIEPPDALEWATKPTPSEPANPPCHSPGG